MSIVFETPRLRIRTLRADDLRWLVRLHGDPEVMRYVRDPESPEATALRLEQLLADAREEPRLGVWPAELRETGEVIGWFVLTRLDGGEEIELGYRLFPAHWGRGYATEGTRALVDHAFSVFDVDRVVAVVRPGNAASHRVLEKAGFVRGEDRVAYGIELAFHERRRVASAPGD